MTCLIKYMKHNKHDDCTDEKNAQFSELGYNNTTKVCRGKGNKIMTSQDGNQRYLIVSRKNTSTNYGVTTCYYIQINMCALIYRE